MDNSALRPAVLSGLAAALFLDGALVLPFGLSGLIQLMGLDMTEPPPAVVTLLMAVMLGCLALGGALWGWALSRITGAGQKQRMAVASLASYGLAALVAALTLGSLEPAAANILPLPLHRVFTVMFVPAVFLVAAANGAGFGLALQDRAVGARLAIAAGLAAALAFLVVNLTLDAFGFRVGAPFAAQRATMLVTAFTSNAGAALAGGAVMGWLLKNRSA